VTLPRFFIHTHPNDLWLGIGICVIDCAITISILSISFGIELLPETTDTFLREEKKGEQTDD